MLWNRLDGSPQQQEWVDFHSNIVIPVFRYPRKQQTSISLHVDYDGDAICRVVQCLGIENNSDFRCKGDTHPDVLYETLRSYLHKHDMCESIIDHNLVQAS